MGRRNVIGNNHICARRGNKGIDLKTYQERLPTTPGNNTVALDRATKVSIFVDSDMIQNRYIPDNLILKLHLRLLYKILDMVRQKSKYLNLSHLKQ